MPRLINSLMVVIAVGGCFCPVALNYPHHQQHQQQQYHQQPQHHDPELITAEEIIHYRSDSRFGLQMDEQLNTISSSDESGRSDGDTPDDLILVTHGQLNALQPSAHQRHPQQQQHYQRNYMLTSGKETASESDKLPEPTHKQHSAELEESSGDGAPISGGIELGRGNDKIPANLAVMGEAETSYATPIDMSDFLALLPVAKLKVIAANYYGNDAEVRRTSAFLSTPQFTLLRQQIMVLPELAAAFTYLNHSGLDVLQFVQNITQLMDVDETETDTSTAAIMETIEGGCYGEEATDNGPTGSMTAITPEAEAPATPTTTMATKAEPTPPVNGPEQLNGLHGLVDSILQTLPQDQILATFFDKLETDERFSKFINRIGQAEFSRILANMQNSTQLQNFVYMLHSNGIHLHRIADTVKAYFFLGTL